MGLWFAFRDLLGLGIFGFSLRERERESEREHLSLSLPASLPPSLPPSLPLSLSLSLSLSFFLFPTQQLSLCNDCRSASRVLAPTSAELGPRSRPEAVETRLMFRV